MNRPASHDSDAQFDFSFEVAGFAADTFGVAEFSGTEAISKPYQFEITLLSQKNFDEDKDIFNADATLTIHCKGKHYPHHGIVRSFTHFGEPRPGLFLYKIELTPRLDLLRVTQHNQVFLDKTLPEIIKLVFKECNLFEYEFRLLYSYPMLDYICQYNESHFDFISRWLENHGLYYFFEQSGVREKLIIADSITAEVACSSEPLQFTPADGLAKPHYDTVVNKIIAKRRTVPHKVVLKDYNYQTPTVDLIVEHEVSPDGVGTHYSYGDTFMTSEIGQGLAEVRAQAFSCREIMMHGAGYAPCLVAGHTFELGNHPRPNWNASYQIVSVKHRGWKNWQGITVASAGKAIDRPGYENVFEAIDAKTQFRPERTTPRPEFKGLLTAFVDSAQSGQYAELDELGRYKVRLPFDLADKGGGKASCWMRLAQPYMGRDFGMHFPLHKGTEVLLSFVDGDVDSPVIVSAVPNAELGNVVKDASHTGNTIRTSSGNMLHMSDLSGHERVCLSTPRADTKITMGTYHPSGNASAATGTSAGTSQQQAAESPFSLVMESGGNCSTTAFTISEYTLNRGTMALAVGTTSLFNASSQLSKSSSSLLDATEWSRGSISHLAMGDFNKTGKNINTFARERLTLMGGASPILNTPLKLVNGLMAVEAAINTAASGFDIFVQVASRYMAQALTNGKPFWIPEKVMNGLGLADTIVGLGTGVVGGIGFGIANSTILGNVFNALASGKKLAPASINLDSDGIDMTVSPMVSPLAEFKMTYGGSMIPHSGIKLFNPAMPTALIESSLSPTPNRALLQLTGGVDIKLAVEPVGFALEMGPSSAMLSFKPLGSKIFLTPATMSLSVASQQKLELAPTGAKLSSPSFVDVEGIAGVRVNGGAASTINGQLVMIQGTQVLLG